MVIGNIIKRQLACMQQVISRTNDTIQKNLEGSLLSSAIGS